MDKIKRKIYIDKIIDFMKNDYPLFHNLKLYGFYDQLSNEEMDYIFSNIFEQLVNVEVYRYESIGYNQNDDIIYFENSDGDWGKYEYDNNHNKIYYENSNGGWEKYEYDENNNIIYSEHSNGYWEKFEYNDNGNIIYYEDSHGEIVDNK